jgi:hypothetical protein
VEQFKIALRSLTQEVCRQLEGQEIPKKLVVTVDNQPTPHVALDFDRPGLSDLRGTLSIGLLKLPEYGEAAEAIEKDPELSKGIIIDAGGFLCKPERTNITRALLVNFLWRYTREGVQCDWDETRFLETFRELEVAFDRKTVVFHTTLPLTNLKVEVPLDFGDGLSLLPASIEELERWLNPDPILAPFGNGPPRWDPHHVDKPAVLHSRKEVVGRPPTEKYEVPRVNVDDVINALRLVLNAPILPIFQENETEGLIAWGGRGTSWGWLPPSVRTTVTLNQENATEVIRVWRLLRTTPNIGFLRLPLRRWGSSLQRPDYEDRLVDAWIGLEGLLLGEGEGELSFRAAVRLAQFLGTSGVDRKTIFHVARDSYNWRSKIVHAGTSNDKAIKKLTRTRPLPEAAQLTTEYLRSALLKVLALPGRFDPNRLEFDLLGRDAQAL